MPQRPNSERFNVTLATETKRRLDERARDCKMGRSQLIERLVESYIDVHDRKAAENRTGREAT